MANKEEMYIARNLKRASLFRQAADSKKAEILLRSVLDKHPHHPQANHELGIILQESFSVEESLQYFRSALEADPQQEKYWLSYIDALIDAENLEDAM